MRPSPRSAVPLLLCCAWLYAPSAHAAPCGPAPTPDTELTDAWIAPSGAVWVVAAQGAIGQRDDDGTWCWQRPTPTESWTAVWGSAEDDVRFASATGAVLHYDGHTFRVERAADGTRIDDLWGSGPCDVYAVGSEGRAQHFDGEAWRAIDPEPGYQLRAVWGADAAHVWAVGRIPTRTVVSSSTTLGGVDLVVLRRTARGWTREASWSQTYGGGGLSAIDGTSAHDVWAVGLNQPAGAATGVSIGVHFDGTRWAAVDPAGLHVGRGFRGVAAGLPEAPDGVLIMTSDGALRGTPRPGARTGGATLDWTRDLAAPPMLDHVTQRDGALWAVGPNLTVLRATPAGWTRVLPGEIAAAPNSR